MGGKISVNVNNGHTMELTQEKHDGLITCTTAGYTAKISPGDLVMLINYYVNCKNGTEISDYIDKEC